MAVELMQRMGSERAHETKATRSDYCIFISGIFGTNAGLHNDTFGIVPALAKTYGGTENVTAFNSAISTDMPNPNRYIAIETAIKAKVKEGPVDVVVHSLGSTELWRVLKSMRDKDPGFFKNIENKEKLRFVLMGPSGFNKGILSKIHYAVNTPRVILKTGRGLHALSTWRPEDIPQQSLAKALKKYSNMDSRFRTEWSEGEGNGEFLTERERIVLEKYYKDLRMAVEQGKNRRARRIVRRIGKDFKDPLQRVFDVTTEVGKKKKDKVNYGGFDGVRLLVRAGGKKPMEEFLRLEKEGFCVDFHIPQYDFLVPLWKVAKFFKGKESEMSKHTVIGWGEGHGFPGLQRKRFAEAVKNSRLQ